MIQKPVFLNVDSMKHPVLCNKAKDPHFHLKDWETHSTEVSPFIVLTCDGIRCTLNRLVSG